MHISESKMETDMHSESKMETNEELTDVLEEDEGPPPGWEKVLVHQMPLSCKPELQPSSAVSSDIETSSKQEDIEDDDGPPPGWELHSIADALTKPQPSTTDPEISNKQDIAKNIDKESQPVSQSILIPERSTPPKPAVQQLPSSATEIRSKGDLNNRVKRPTSGKPFASQQQLFPPGSNPSTPIPASSSSEKAQLVCGTCRNLLLYARGSKWVRCSGCQEVNFVLEAHEVGHVNCGGCSTLLMYQYGAPAVQCSSCRTVTEIGENNRRPPLSVQQAQRRRRHSNRAP